MSPTHTYKTQKEKIVGFEPTTFCLTDKCSTNELNIFLKEKIAVCVFLYGCGRRIRTASLAYEASELPLLHLRNGSRNGA